MAGARDRRAVVAGALELGGDVEQGHRLAPPAGGGIALEHRGEAEPAQLALERVEPGALGDHPGADVDVAVEEPADRTGDRAVDLLAHEHHQLPDPRQLALERCGAPGHAGAAARHPLPLRRRHSR